MKAYTLDHLISIERVASRSVNASKAFAEGSDRKLLDDLTTLIAEIRQAASCTSDGVIDTNHLYEHTL